MDDEDESGDLKKLKEKELVKHDFPEHHQEVGGLIVESINVSQ